MTDDTNIHEHKMGQFEKMRLVLELRYLHGLTLEQVGDLLGVTRERIRQIESKAIRLLRANPKLREKAIAVLREIDQI